MVDQEYRAYFEELLDAVSKKGFRLTSDTEIDGDRVITYEKYQIILCLIQKSHSIAFDVYADLRKGIYEIGDLHLISRKMFDLKKLCLSYNAREMNTTERLYPANRQGEDTTTSGL